MLWIRVKSNGSKLLKNIWLDLTSEERWCRKRHCYQVNDWSSTILVSKGGAYFLRHCQPFSNKISLWVKGGTYFFQYKKYCPPFTSKNILSTKRRNVFFFSTKNTFLLLLITLFLVLKGGTYFFQYKNTVHLLVIEYFWYMWPENHWLDNNVNAKFLWMLESINPYLG